MDSIQNPTLIKTSTQPIVEPPQVSSAPISPKKNNKMPIVLLLIFVLLLAVLGAYYFMTQNNTTSGKSIETQESTSIPTPTMTDEEEIESIEIEASDSSDFEEIKKDINSL